MSAAEVREGPGVDIQAPFPPRSSTRRRSTAKPATVTRRLSPCSLCHDTRRIAVSFVYPTSPSTLAYMAAPRDARRWHHSCARTRHNCEQSASPRPSTHSGRHVAHQPPRPNAPVSRCRTPPSRLAGDHDCLSISPRKLRPIVTHEIGTSGATCTRKGRRRRGCV